MSGQSTKLIKAARIKTGALAGFISIDESGQSQELRFVEKETA